MTKPTGEPRRYVRADLIKYFRRHPGVTVWLDDVCAELRVTDPKRVQNGINNMRHDEPAIGAHIDVVRPGQAWIYRPPADGTDPFAEPLTRAPGSGDTPAHPPQARNELFEKLGMIEEGSAALLRDESGNIWTARRM